MGLGYARGPGPKNIDHQRLCDVLSDIRRHRHARIDEKRPMPVWTQAGCAVGGRTLSVGGRVVAHEAGITQRVVLIEFDSFEQAVAAYESEAYQKALVTLSGSAERDFRIIEGLA